MYISAVSREEMGPKLLQEIAAYRYQVFVRTLGWRLDCPVGCELDQFDHAEAHYVLLREDSGALAGCARLLPTLQPYLLQQVFPMLAPGLLPHDAAVWELSRFAVLSPALFGASQRTAVAEESAKLRRPTTDRPRSALPQFSSEQAVALLQAALDHARRLGARSLVTVSPVGIDRLLSMAGFNTRALAPPQTVGGHRLFACQIECQGRHVLSLPASSRLPSAQAA
ncbi:GNAT family N-acetyltransferase [Paucibacter sp. DJ1R-11]|uniref:acyl-homoserine-lactone synthase n=1 Tax=Paucibacter sp. DJ1R-11 TaxID=2893556 RepID=UPI0021E3AAC0|nr:acyl-homoserine-lactone synthase [Paucibacter sp. DJ1R-11]MCV2366035.1 GNAT family N-acetyltransferase [Paucibacter sp. DJ1R-11]